MCGGNCDTCGQYTGPSCYCNSCGSGGSFIHPLPEDKKLPVRKPDIKKRNRVQTRIKMAKIVGDELCYDCISPELENDCSDLSPDWKETGSVICEQGATGNTGYSLTELRDVNPCSETYNNTTFRRQPSINCLPVVNLEVFLYDITC